VVVIGVRGHRVRRPTPGSAPAFSPDGRWIAFVAPDHRLMIVPAYGSHRGPRPVGGARAVSVDWQPKPRGRNPACAAPPGSTVTASAP
jgi:Tol biopolymer transport system component